LKKQKSQNYNVKHKHFLSTDSCEVNSSESDSKHNNSRPKAPGRESDSNSDNNYKKQNIKLKSKGNSILVVRVDCKPAEPKFLDISSLNKNWKHLRGAVSNLFTLGDTDIKKITLECANGKTIVVADDTNLECWPTKIDVAMIKVRFFTTDPDISS